MEPATVFWMIVSAFITLIYVPIIYFQNKYNDKLCAENEELKSEVESLQKKLKSEEKVYNELEIMTGKIEKKYDFMCNNTRKFNVGDKFEIYEITKVDVNIPSIIENIIRGSIQFFQSILGGKPTVPSNKIGFIYYCKNTEIWYNEQELIERKLKTNKKTKK